MAQDEHTYGFSKADASDIAQLIGNGDGEYQEGGLRGGGSSGATAVCVAHASGIAARSGATLGSASCVRLTISGGTRATTTNTITVYNDFLSAITAGVDIVVTKVDGIWLVIAEDCT